MLIDACLGAAGGFVKDAVDGIENELSLELSFDIILLVEEEDDCLRAVVLGVYCDTGL